MSMAVVGMSVVVLGYASYLTMLFALRRFTYRTWLFHAVLLAGMSMALVGVAVGDPWLPASIAIGLGAAWFPLTRRELTIVGSTRLTLGTGDRLPRFAALRADGTPITDQDVVGQAPALLMLYRGWWCPSTRALLDELLDYHERLASAGVTTFAASVDPPDQAAGMQEHVGDEITIVCSFPVAVLDSIGARDRRGAPWYDRLIFRAPGGDIAMPAALVVDASGRIAYAFRARRVDDRAHPRDILASLKARTLAG
jgi:peroxiredoxin